MVLAPYRWDLLTTIPPNGYLDAGNGLAQPSLVLLEQIRTVDKQRLSGYIGRLDKKHIQGINHALAVSIGLIEPVPPKLTLCLSFCWEPGCAFPSSAG